MSASPKKSPVVSPASRMDTTPAPAGSTPWPVGASPLYSTTWRHPEHAYRVTESDDDLHAVPDFDRRGETRFDARWAGSDGG